MQIHELGARTPGVYDYAALDTGSQTYKAQVGDLKPQYTSYDSANPTSWADVATMGSNTPISTFFERVTYIARNVRYLWKLIGSNAFSNVAETISGAIGNTALPTTAKDISGAIAEHEEDISQINDNLSATSFNLTRNTANVSSGSGKGIYDKASKTVRIYLQWNNTDNVSSNATLFTIPSAYRPSSAVTGYGIVRTSGDVPLPATYSVSTAGEVAQTASNAARGGFSMIEYILG